MQTTTSDLEAIVIKLNNLLHQLEHTQQLARPDRPRGLLIADADIVNLDKFTECVKSDIVLFKYSTSWTTADLMANLRACLAPISPGSLELFGWMFHGDMQSFALTSDVPMSISDKYNVAQWQPLMRLMQEVDTYMHPDHKRIDMVSCSLTHNTEFKPMIDLIKAVTNYAVCTSDDDTGNTPGADWELETGRVDLIGSYLKPNTKELIGDVPFVLNGWYRVTFEIAMNDYFVREMKFGKLQNWQINQLNDILRNIVKEIKTSNVHRDYKSVVYNDLTKLADKFDFRIQPKKTYANDSNGLPVLFYSRSDIDKIHNIINRQTYNGKQVFVSTSINITKTLYDARYQRLIRGAR